MNYVTITMRRFEHKIDKSKIKMDVFSACCWTKSNRRSASTSCLKLLSILDIYEKMFQQKLFIFTLEAKYFYHCQYLLVKNNELNKETQ